MKFSEKWLREWVNPSVDTETLLEQLTMLGLEVDDSVDLSGLFDGVVVGHVKSVESHPDADRLNVCQVSAGDEDFQVVCGAPNVRAGMKTAFAMVGAKLPSGMKIKKAKLRGVQSSGMLCSESELELSDASDGIMSLPDDATTGQSLIQYLELDDTIIDIDITPNRGDCFCIRGVARDISARNNIAIKELDHSVVEIKSQKSMAVDVEADCACVNYTGRVIEGINNSVTAPLWMTERLRRSGIRSISLLVDVTNYVMLELGQPMHAFDISTLTGGIQVRHALKDEKLVLLDGREITLNVNTTVIADDSGAIGIAGIMGGDKTGCEETTTDVFLESALFLPEHIAGKSRSYGLHTESGHRFERGVDPGLQQDAIEYATRLILEICQQGSPGELTVYTDNARMPKAGDIFLRSSRIKRILGFDIPAEQVESVLGKLGIGLQATDDGWHITAPSYRYDIRIEADLIEELARVYGYDKLPRTFPELAPEFKSVKDNQNDQEKIKHFLVSRGFQEVVTYSFVDPNVQAQLHPDAKVLPLANPISSDMAQMRISHFTGLLSTLKHNLNRQLNDVSIFESGLKFELDGDDLQQTRVLSGLLSGKVRPEHWSDNVKDVDFFDLKGLVEALFDFAHLDGIEYTSAANPAFHPGQSAKISLQGETLGWIGTLHPNLQKNLSLSQTAVMFEIKQSVLETAFLPEFKAISKYPSVRRDISMVINDDVPLAEVERVINDISSKYLQKIVIFDVYRGEKVGDGVKSVAFGLILQDKSRTLDESEVESSVVNIIKVLEDKFSATLRM